MAPFTTRFLYQKVIFVLHAVSIYLLPLFTFVSDYIFRLQGDDGSDFSDKKVEFLETESDAAEFGDCEEDGVEEEEKPEMFLKFKFQTYDEFRQIQKETGNPINCEVVPCVSSTSKYEFTSERNSVSTFVEEIETFPVREIEINSSFENEKGLSEVHEKGKEILVIDDEKVSKEIEVVEFTEKFEDKGKSEEGILGNHEPIEKNSVISDSESESTIFEHIRSEMNRIGDSYSDGFLSDGDFGVEFDLENESESSAFEENQDLSDDFDEDSEIMEELKKLETQDHDDLNPDFLRDKDFNEDLGSVNDAEFVAKDDDLESKPRSKDSSMADSEDANKLESLWEHQELIEQLKMELKKVKATGLPTILEESESPKITDDLKPWKIDEFKREDCIGELHKFYKSYRERMRKFDIMNYQKMYAMGFLQLKDPLQSISKQKRPPPTLKSLVSQNLWLFKHRIHGSDPMKKFIAELQGDLEVVYVGQMCLSWEFLHWQYEKAWDLWDSDPRGRRRYNEVAGEFQQFQVLVQRFVEDETFQGPRVQNYVKSRCAVRNLLQVPVIREDNLKRKARKLDVDEYVITSDMLVEIVEESIRIFWRFVRADKDCAVASVNGNKKVPEFLDAEDLNLLAEIKKVLLKKERKLKDVLRSENCILRKFRRSSEDDSDQVLYFFSQVDMKLVARVLNMSKITRDQLVWCHNKLSRISFVNRKIHVEPAFLLFPS